jgi:hypothetical protein
LHSAVALLIGYYHKDITSGLEDCPMKAIRLAIFFLVSTTNSVFAGNLLCPPPQGAPCPTYHEVAGAGVTDIAGDIQGVSRTSDSSQFLEAQYIKNTAGAYASPSANLVLTAPLSGYISLPKNIPVAYAAVAAAAEGGGEAIALESYYLEIIGPKPTVDVESAVRVQGIVATSTGSYSISMASVFAVNPTDVTLGSWVDDDFNNPGDTLYGGFGANYTEPCGTPACPELQVYDGLGGPLVSYTLSQGSNSVSNPIVNRRPFSVADFHTGTLYQVYIETQVEGDIGADGSASALEAALMMDPIFSIAPGVANASQYSIEVSPGVGNIAAPEASTWTMILLGFGGLAYTASGYRRTIRQSQAQ